MALGSTLTPSDIDGSMCRMTAHQQWTAEQIPDQTGRVFLVTGANSGLGLATTRALTARGARVLLAVRDVAKGRRAAAGITHEQPGAQVEVGHLDLADLDSVRAFAHQVRADHPRLDVLVNNAGVMAPPRSLSAQGHELQFACNHLGHFALTGLLLDLLSVGRDPRVVTVSSLNHRRGAFASTTSTASGATRRWPSTTSPSSRTPSSAGSSTGG